MRDTTLIPAQQDLQSAERRVLKIALNFKKKGVVVPAALAGVSALVASAAASAAERLGNPEPLRFGADLQTQISALAASPAAESIAYLAATLQKYHTAVETMATRAGLQLAPMAHGTPKEAFAGVVRSALGLG